MRDVKVRKVRGGWRLEQHGCVLSEVLRRPGPTHSVFDLLAAAVHCFSPGPRVSVLGFAAGGLVAPLRMLGGNHQVRGVDLSLDGFRVFRAAALEWAGDVTVEEAEAAAWLRRQRRRFDAIVEDLSVPQDGDVVKPEVSWRVLPAALRAKLAPGGVVITNLLPTPGMSWRALIAACRTGPGVAVGLDGFHNRILIQGRGMGEAREAGCRLRAALVRLGSRMADGLAVRRLDDRI